MEGKKQAVKKEYSVTRYVVGFLLALILTLAAYEVAINKLLDGKAFIIFLMVLAAIQAFVQLIFFLHFGQESASKSKWNQAAFYLMLIILFIIVGGSLWIMENLNYNMMSPMQMNEYMLHESNKGF